MFPPSFQGDVAVWAKQIGTFLQQWTQRLEAEAEAYIAQTTQLASGIVTTNIRQAMSTQSLLTSGLTAPTTTAGTNTVSWTSSVATYTITHSLGTVPDWQVSTGVSAAVVQHTSNATTVAANVLNTTANTAQTTTLSFFYW